MGATFRCQVPEEHRETSLSLPLLQCSLCVVVFLPSSVVIPYSGAEAGKGYRWWLSGAAMCTVIHGTQVEGGH